MAFVMFVMLLNPSYAYAMEEYEKVEMLTQEHMQDIQDMIPDAAWTEETNIENITPTYNTKQEVNGYIVLLKTKDLDSGYIQFRYISGNLEMISYTFSGKHKTSNIEGKIYYLGSLNFAYKDDGDYYCIVGYEEDKLTLADLEEMVTDNIISLEAATYEARSITLVPNFSSSYMVIMSDFTGYSEHCSPTSGVNWVKYWAYCRGMSNLVSSNGSTMSNLQIFSRLYSLMKTNIGKTGTYPADKASGLRTYCNEHSLTLSAAYYTSTPLSFTGYKNSINNGNPVLLSLTDEAGSSYGDHGIMGVGYVGTTAVILDGWTRATVYVVYSELGVGGYCQVSF